jgi:hypothetical protein
MFQLYTLTDVDFRSHHNNAYIGSELRSFTLILSNLRYRPYDVKGKGKAVPLQAWSGPEGSRKLRFPEYMTTQDGGKVIRLRHRPPLPPGNTPGTHFC